MQRIHDASDITKPCYSCGFCPYGTIVEAYPLHVPEQEYAREHGMWVKFSCGWIPCAKEDPEATEDINTVILQNLVDNPYSCQVFGHECPVYYNAEYVSEQEMKDLINSLIKKSSSAREQVRANTDSKK